MKNLKKQLSAVVLATVFSSMQTAMSVPFDTGLGSGNGGAVINSTTGGFVGATTGSGTADLNFNGDTHVNWNTLNINKGESLNYNAVQGASGLTILNTVNQGVSKIYGQIKANDGISNLVISNPNGLIFDGAKMMSAGDINLTTQSVNATFTNGEININKTATTNPVEVVSIKDSNFTTTGEFNILAPAINAVNSKFTAGNGVKLVTANGQDYLSTGNAAPKDAVKLEAVNVDGDVYIVSDKGYVRTTNGGTINGDLTIASDDSVIMNYNANGERLHVTGDVNAKANGAAMYARYTDVDGNLNMQNGGGFLEVANVNVGEDMNLKTVAQSENAYGYKHFTHVIGENNIEGNVTIDSKDNVHIGNYKYEEEQLLKGDLTVGGTLDVHAHDGHIMTSINVDADKVKMTSDNLNVLATENARIKANEYEFKSNGYIGSVTGYEKEDGSMVTADSQVVALMENYIFIPKDIKSHAPMNISGGNVKMIDAPDQAKVYISSDKDLLVTGANAGDIYITAENSRLDITGSDVHAKTINVGDKTKTLKVDFPERDFVTNYTNIRDKKVVTIAKDEEITYELANEPTNGYNAGKDIDDPRAANTTYLVGPGYDPVPPPPTPTPVDPPTDEPGRQLYHWVPEDVTKAPASTPVAYAADLDDEEEVPVRKNVDGSVTVVRAFPME